MLFAQEQTDRYAEITNPKLLHINREEPRSTFSSFTDLKEALAAGYISKGSDVLLLNGNWKFHYTDRFNERPKQGFQNSGFDDSQWSNIQVPGNWEVQGFGVPIYVNATYEFTSPGHAPTGINRILRLFRKNSIQLVPIGNCSLFRTTGRKRR